MLVSPKDLLYQQARYQDMLQEADQLRLLAQLHPPDEKPTLWVRLRDHITHLTHQVTDTSLDTLPPCDSTEALAQ